MAIISISIEKKLDDHRGVVFGIELCRNSRFGFAIVDVVIQTINRNEPRGVHYHTRSSGKIEIFVHVCGTAELVWHEKSTPNAQCRQTMKPLTVAGQVYLVEPETCHKVIGRSDDPFLMLSLNNVAYNKEHDFRCEHDLAKDP